MQDAHKSSPREQLGDMGLCVPGSCQTLALTVDMMDKQTGWISRLAGQADWVDRRTVA